MARPSSHIRKSLRGLIGTAGILAGLAFAPHALACTNPAGSAGQIIYNGDENKMTYCDGTNWISMGDGTDANTTGAVAPTTGLVGHWTLDETTGSTITDNGSGTNNGTWTDGSGNSVAEETGAGKVNTALTFDGSNDQIVIDGTATELQISGNFTVSAWFRSTGGSGSSDIVAKGIGTSANYWIMIDGNDVTAGYYNGTDWNELTTSGTNYRDSQWHHAVVTKTGSIAELFVDGVSIGSWSDGSTAQTGAQDLYIGGSSGRRFTGSIDDVRVYNQALSATEVLALFRATGGTANDSLIGHWKLDDTAANTTATNSGTGGGTYNGTMVSMTGAANTTGGKLGTALSFDNTGSDYIDTADIDFPTGGFSYGGWFKTSSAASMSILRKFASGTDQIALYIGAGVVECGLNDNGGALDWRAVDTGATTYNDGEWHHAMCVVDGTNVLMYVDGAYIGASAAHDNAFPTNNVVWKIGEGIDGDLDDIRIYNRALTASEVGAVYAGCAAGSMVYNSDHSVPQYCNGTDWVAMGPVRDVSDGLVAHFEMEEASGTITDSVNSITTTEAGSGSFTYSESAPIGNGIRFPSGSGHRAFSAGNPAVLQITDALTVSAWVKWDDEAGYVVSKRGATPDRGYRLEITSGGNAQFSISPDGTNLEVSGLSSALTSGQWYLITGVYEPSTRVSIYVNGVLENEDNTGISASIFNSTQDFFIGNWTFNNNTGDYNGVIDDVRIYNRVISEAEIMDLYDLGMPTGDITTGLVGYWPMDEASGGTTVTDSGSGGNDGTWQGTGNIVSVPGIIGTAFDFNGTDNQVLVSTPGYSFTAYSYCLWFRGDSNSIGSAEAPFGVSSNNDSFGFLYSASGNPKGYHYSGSYDNLAAPSFTGGTWYHACQTWDGSTVKLYIDGSVSDTASVGSMTAPDGDLTIGAWAGGDLFPGHVDDMRLYDRALTDADVVTLYKLGAGTCSNPVGKEGDLIFNDDGGVDALTYCDGANWQMIGKSN